MSSKNTDNGHTYSNNLHRLPGTDDNQEGGLIIKKKVQATGDGDQHVFKVPEIPKSQLGLDTLASQKRSQAADDVKTSKRPREEYKERHLREQRVDTPSSTRSSHHDYYDKIRPAPKDNHRGLTYGKKGSKQDRPHDDDREYDNDDRRYATPNIRSNRG